MRVSACGLSSTSIMEVRGQDYTVSASEARNMASQANDVVTFGGNTPSHVSTRSKREHERTPPPLWGGGVLY